MNDAQIPDFSNELTLTRTPGGTDTVKAGISFSLVISAQVLGTVENLTLTGTRAINATGNASNNILTGNSGANTLTGGAGSQDIIQFGNDVFADFAAVLAATQVGSDTVITRDASNVVTLKNVALANLQQDDFQFIAA